MIRSGYISIDLKLRERYNLEQKTRDVRTDSKSCSEGSHDRAKGKAFQGDIFTYDEEFPMTRSEIKEKSPIRRMGRDRRPESAKQRTNIDRGGECKLTFALGDVIASAAFSQRHKFVREFCLRNVGVPIREMNHGS